MAAIAAELQPRYRALPAFGAATGLRPEEWGALERRHVDRQRRIVRIEQKNVEARIEPGGKTKNSVREVPLTRAALAGPRPGGHPRRLDTPLVRRSRRPEGGIPLNLDNFAVDRDVGRPPFSRPQVVRRRRRRDPPIDDMRDTSCRLVFRTRSAAGVTVFAGWPASSGLLA